MAQISKDHPLNALFRAMVEQAFTQSFRLREPAIIAYLSDMLASFAHMSEVYKLVDINGKPLDEVAEMLYYADVRLGAQSFYQEREVHRHIGDYTLFWAGVYPEALPKVRAMSRKDHLIDYVKQGKQSYYIVSLFDVGEWREEAPLFRILSDHFETCMQGLHAARHQWEALAKQARGEQNSLQW